MFGTNPLYLLFSREAISPKSPPHLFLVLLFRVATHHVPKCRFTQVQIVFEVLHVGEGERGRGREGKEEKLKNGKRSKGLWFSSSCNFVLQLLLFYSLRHFIVFHIVAVAGSKVWPFYQHCWLSISCDDVRSPNMVTPVSEIRSLIPTHYQGFRSYIFLLFRIIKHDNSLDGIFLFWRGHVFWSNHPRVQAANIHSTNNISSVTKKFLNENKCM